MDPVTNLPPHTYGVGVTASTEPTPIPILVRALTTCLGGVLPSHESSALRFNIQEVSDWGLSSRTTGRYTCLGSTRMRAWCTVSGTESLPLPADDKSHAGYRYEELVSHSDKTHLEVYPHRMVTKLRCHFLHTEVVERAT